MGTPDTYTSSDGKTTVQLKAGSPCCFNYHVGEPTNDLPSDAIYISYDGVVVIRNGKLFEVYPDTSYVELLAETVPSFDKRGYPVHFDDISFYRHLGIVYYRTMYCIRRVDDDKWVQTDGASISPSLSYVTWLDRTLFDGKLEVVNFMKVFDLHRHHRIVKIKMAKKFIKSKR